METSELFRTKVLAIDLVKGVDPVPPASIVNPLKVTEDSTLIYDQNTTNTQDDVAKSSLTRAAICSALRGGTATLNGNMESTVDGLEAPAIGKYLECCGMTLTECQIVEMADTTGLDVDSTLTGLTSGATGTIVGLDPTKLAIKLDTATEFETEDVQDQATTTFTLTNHYALITKKAFQYSPDTDNFDNGSIFFFRKNSVEAIKEALGNLSFTINYGEFAKFAMTFLGKTDIENRGAGTFPNIPEITSCMGKFVKNGLTMRYDGNVDTPSNTSVEYNYGAQPALLGDASDETGYVGTIIASRADASANINLYRRDLDTIDYEALRDINTIFDTTYLHGAGEYNRTLFVRQKLQIDTVTNSDENQVQSTQLSCACVGGDDDDSYLLFW